MRMWEPVRRANQFFSADKVPGMTRQWGFYVSSDLEEHNERRK